MHSEDLLGKRGGGVWGLGTANGCSVAEVNYGGAFHLYIDAMQVD